MAQFVPGAELARRFYEEVVGAAVDPWVHAAALVGTGSDVLGFDTARSTDHGWGPRMHVFVAAADVAAVTSAVEAALPDTFAGWPTRYGWDAVPVQSHVVVCGSRRGSESTLASTREPGCRPTTGWPCLSNSSLR